LRSSNYCYISDIAGVVDSAQDRLAQRMDPIMSITTWFDARIQKLVDAVDEAVTMELGAHLSDLESELTKVIQQQSNLIITNLTAQVVSGVEQVIANAAGNVDKVVGDVGGTITNTMDHFTIDTAALAQAVAQAIRGLLPFGRKGQS
jgi:hypothetical protein